MKHIKQKAFTLIELLVVVAIIGILAAVGVTTFGGFQDKAKISTTKTNHKTVVKKAALIISECGIEGSVKMMSKVRDTTSYAITCYGNQFSFFADYFINHMDNNGRWKNPFKASGNRVQQPGWCSNAQSGDSNVGFVWINSRSGWDNVTICTCVETPCSEKSNILEDKLYIN